MRPLRPFCGTVSNAQLLTLPATISTSANGVVTTQLSFLPPASSSATDVPESSESRPARVLPPEPPPTITKSNVSVTRVSPRAYFAAETRLLRRFLQERFQEAFSSEVGTGSREENASKTNTFDFAAKTRGLAVTKSSKPGLLPFPKQVGVDTYPSHPLAMPG